MANEDPRRPAPAWKKDVKQPGERKREAQPDWKKEPVGQAPAQGMSRRTKLGITLAGFLAVSGILTAVVLWFLPPKLSCLVLIGASYETNLAIPPNVYGWKGLEDLEQFADKNLLSSSWWGGGVPKLRYGPKKIFDDVWLEGLANVKEKTVILFVAAHGGADSKGAYLLADDPRGLKVIRLEQLLEGLKARGLEDKNKVLILDATQVTASWHLGLLHNDFARELEKLEDAIKKVPRLVVISASGPDQRSWVSEEWRRSIFAHHVIEGMKGAADKDQSQRVTAQELYDHVHDQVSRWAQANRLAVQTPVMLGDRERASKMDLVRLQAPYQAPDAESAPGAAFTMPAELEPAWNRCQELRSQVPSPAVYSPHLWRQYQDTLLRHEQLLRAGEKGKAGELANELARLEDAITRFRSLDLTAAQNALPLAAALGVPSPWSSQETQNKFSELWSIPAAEQAAKWPGKWSELRKWAQGQATGADKLLRVQLSGLLLDRAAENPERNLKTACALLRVLDDDGSPRPAEPHYMAMLRRDLPEKEPPADLLQLTLQVRRSAEEIVLATNGDGKAHPYSERVHPWTAEKVGRADRERRLGEDLVFGSEEAAWKRACGHLEKARDLYKSAGNDTVEVRRALGLRDEVLAGLPYHAHWVARRRLLEPGPQKENLVLLEEIEKLWKNTHALVLRLEKPDPAVIHSVAREGENSLKELSDAVQKGFADIQGRFRQRCEDLRDVRTQTPLQEIEDALGVPLIEADLRLSLLRNSRRISAELNARAAPQAGKPPSAAETSEEARDQAQRQGRMAIATLGARWIDESQRGSDTNFGTLARWISQPDSKRWWELLTPAGEQVGHHWQRLSEEINERTDAGRRAELKKAAPDLDRADRLARLIQGAAVAQLTLDPVAESRALAVHRLLLAQAERTFHDHWFAENPEATPWYQASVDRYLRDAEALMLKGRGDLEPREREPSLEEVKKARDRLKPVQLAVTSQQHLAVTSERSVELAYRLEGPEAILPGFPVLWWKEVGKSVSAKPAADSARRIVEPFGQEKPRSPFDFTFTLNNPFDALDPTRNPSAPSMETTRVHLHGLHRGQQLHFQTQVDMHRGASLVASQYRVPRTSGMAVRADGPTFDLFAESRGTVAIVVDYSGSMLAKQKDGDTRMKKALDSLEEVLRGLPKGITLSLWTLGQSIDDNRGITPEDTVKRYRAPRSWDPDQLVSLMDGLRSLKPFNYTPLARSLIMASEDLRNAEGFKTLVVLTDGMDTCFEPGKRDGQEHRGDPTYNKDGKEKIPTFLQQRLANSGIAINIVGFQIESDEEKEAKAQFAVIEKFNPPGKFFEVKDSKLLAATLRQALTQKLRCRLERNGIPVQVEGVPLQGLDVSRIGKNPFWFTGLEPRVYDAKVHTFSQRMQLDPADFLLVTLTRKGFQRALVAEDYAAKPQTRESDWLLAVLQNQLKPNRMAQLLVTLENHADRVPSPEGTLQQIKPRFAWFEVKASGVTRPLGLRSGNALGYAASAWSLDVPDWPSHPADEPAALTLQAWWLADRYPRSAAKLTRDPARSLDDDFKNHKVPIEGGEIVTVESVQVEDRLVEAEPGKREKHPCLVVRLAFPRGKPVLAQVQTPTVTGHEHHLYIEAERYTGIFWPVTKAQAEKLLTLNLISLDAFKREASRVELNLKPPDLSDFRDPPLPLKVPDISPP